MGRKIFVMAVAGLLLSAGWVLGQQTPATQTTVLHAFAFTPSATATPQDFENLRKATADMVGKVPGLRRAWVGKLRAPLDLGPVAPKREYGIALEFDDAKALDAYADHPAHAAWERVYRRVREAGTTTFDILGE